MYAAPGTERVFDSVVVLGSAGRGGVCGEGRVGWVRMYVLWGGGGCVSGHFGRCLCGVCSACDGE
jgi:hypothetical protein